MAELLREWQGQMKGSLILDQELLKDEGEEREKERKNSRGRGMGKM